MPGGSVVCAHQPNGRGKLSRKNSSRYEGTYLLPNGRYDKKIFPGPYQSALGAYHEWCAEMDERVRKAMESAVRPKPDESEGCMKETTTRKAPDEGEQKTYVLTVVGGAPLYVFDGEDEAFAVCDALTAAAKASGFAAKYDVTEVRRWTY